MITWLTLGPIFLVPSIILTALASCPTFLFRGRVLGGGPVREFYLNHFVLPVLPHDAGVRLVDWFSSATVVQEWLLALVAAININAALLPLLYGLGFCVITVSSWMARKNIELQRRGMR